MTRPTHTSPRFPWPGHVVSPTFHLPSPQERRTHLTTGLGRRVDRVPVGDDQRVFDLPRTAVDRERRAHAQNHVARLADDTLQKRLTGDRNKEVSTR